MRRGRRSKSGGEKRNYSQVPIVRRATILFMLVKWLLGIQRRIHQFICRPQSTIACQVAKKGQAMRTASGHATTGERQRHQFSIRVCDREEKISNKHVVFRGELCTRSARPCPFSISDITVVPPHAAKSRGYHNPASAKKFHNCIN